VQPKVPRHAQGRQVQPAGGEAVLRDRRCIGAEVRINRGDFGITWNALGMVSMESTLVVRAVFTR
jgi:hypothetical protein